MTTTTTAATATITNLPAEINTEHEACLASANDALDHAIACGELLIQAKEQCHHGSWQRWLADNFTGSERTARLYVQLWHKRAAIESKRQRDTVLSIGEARRLITETAPAETDLDGLFPPELKVVIDSALNGPFCPDDFDDRPDVHWLRTKIGHQVKLPASVAWALNAEIETDPPLLRVVPEGELVEAIRILAPYLKHKVGFDFKQVTQYHPTVLRCLMERMAGTLLAELQYRSKVKSNRQYERERAAAFDKFFAGVDARLAELGAA